MTKHLLLEIGMEEVPARFVRSAVEQLTERVEQWLGEHRLSYGSVQMAATPRRIAVVIQDVAEMQTDMQEEAKGPSKKIALGAEGEWTKAALGFARGQNVDAAQLYFKDINGVEYIHALKSSIGVAASELLPKGLQDIIQAMTFPKNMRWGEKEMKFVRPIRWLTALFGEEVIPLELADVKAGRISMGHRFLGESVVIPTAEQYFDLLKKQYVIANMDERKAMIEAQINQMAEAKGWQVPMKEDLLEEVLFLVEYPTALHGSFDESFLNIPQDVLITSMREHQRYFPVMDKGGVLLPYFVTIRNGNDVSLELVAKGNEKVLSARLADARFFYEEDQKADLPYFLGRLENIVFQEELGTVGDKVRRIGALAKRISNKLMISNEQAAVVERIAALCKFDLVTQMVYEFPELQGVMGEDYALKAGESAEVARGIIEHYQPRFSGDQSPASLSGAIVSMADKLDTIFGCFMIGIHPTGSQDPYALRRQASGIVQMIIDHQLTLTLADLFELAEDVYKEADVWKQKEGDNRRMLYDFFALRVKNVLTERQHRYDIVEAVMTAGFDHIPSVIRRAEALSAESQSNMFKTTVESFNRVINLAAKATKTTVDPTLHIEQAEHQLLHAWSDAQTVYRDELARGNEVLALAQLSQLCPVITLYFESVMVMAEDEQVRANRLALLCDIAQQLLKFADFSKIVI